MRYYLLDKIVCPRCAHFPMTLSVNEERNGVLPITDVQPCELYCAYKSVWLETTYEDLPCSTCLSKQVWSGSLVCLSCGSSYPIEERIPAFVLADDTDEWVTEEQSWWNKMYSESEYESRVIKEMVIENTKEEDVPGNRFYERNKYLFAQLRQKITYGALVLEIGAGSSIYVGRLFRPLTEKYLYIATDIARNGLSIGAKILPEGDFVQCSAGKMPFRTKIFDSILLLGVLHHLPLWDTTLQSIIELLKLKGWLLLHEAIEKPRVLGKFRKRSLTAAIDSPHEGEVSLEKLLDILQQEGRIISVRSQMTPLRVLLVWLLGESMERSLIITKSVLALDRIFANYAGRVFRSLGPGEVLVIFENKPK